MVAFWTSEKHTWSFWLPIGDANINCWPIGISSIYACRDSIGIWMQISNTFLSGWTERIIRVLISWWNDEMAEWISNRSFSIFRTLAPLIGKCRILQEFGSNGADWFSFLLCQLNYLFSESVSDRERISQKNI